jgi:chlorobactene glucosyltransferase
MIFEISALSIYLLLGPLTWLMYGYLMFNGRNKMRLLNRPFVPMNGEPPTATIHIPAKDEGQRIARCLQSVLEQDYPSVNVIAIDDRSVDNTGAVMDSVAATDSRLTVLHIQEGSLEPGWTGKNNALFQGQKQATGQWLLFVDSDVVLEKDVLSAAMALCVNRHYDLFSLLPRLESHSIWESLLVPLAAAAASTMYLVPMCNNNKYRNVAFANGQFLLISRTAYEAMGTHAVVKDRYCEDVEISQIVKRIGLRPRVSWGREWASVRMYSSLSNIFKGWSRIYYSARVGNPTRTLLAVGFIFFCCYSFFPAVAWACWRQVHPTAYYLPLLWLIAAVLHGVLILLFVGILYAWSGNPRRNAWSWPLSMAMLLGIMFKALKMCITRKVEWRGTTYAHTMASTLTPPR